MSFQNGSCNSEELLNSVLLSTRLCPQFVDFESPLIDQIILRKEVIQPQVPLRLPCYDLVPIAEFTFGTYSLAVSTVTSGASHFRGLTGGVYKAQEHIHRGMLTRDY